MVADLLIVMRKNVGSGSATKLTQILNTGVKYQLCNFKVYRISIAFGKNFIGTEMKDDVSPLMLNRMRNRQLGIWNFDFNKNVIGNKIKNKLGKQATRKESHA